MRDSSVHTIIRSILDLLFPPSDQERRLRELSVDELERLRSTRQPEKSFITAVCEYRDEMVREVVYALKFTGTRTAAEIIARCIQDEMLAICQEERIFADKIVITPVPLSAQRKRERGFNQSARICRAIKKQDTGNIFDHRKLLEKTRTTADQTELTRSERYGNVCEAFRASSQDVIDCEVIFVIDDVTTTGATLSEARRALAEIYDSRIFCIAFAH